MQQQTRGQLLEAGGIEVSGSWDIILNNVRWVEKPSENGNGWYLGDASNTDNLVMIISDN
jgi:hypothetical protein